MTPLSALIDAFPLPAVAISAEEQIVAANAEARGLLGRSITGRHFITALRQPGLLDAVEASLRDGAPRGADFLTSDERQELTFRVSIRAIPLDDRPGVLVVFEDVTQVERAGQMRRDFVANVSHELRTPLTALIGFLETLQGPAKHDDAGRDRFLAIMAHEAHRMNRLVGDLLSLSRVEAQERVRPTGRVDPGDMARSVINGLTPLAAEAGVDLGCEAPPDPFTIVADPDQLRQVLTNLAENGIKYAGAGARVSITVRPPSYQNALRRDGVEIVVQDTGPGIDEYHIPRLTERFYRVDDHRSREKGGTGLGLAIVKHIITRHRGRLRIESAKGEGTTFTVILPSS